MTRSSIPTAAALLCASLALACSSTQQVTRVDESARARAAESARPPQHGDAPLSAEAPLPAIPDGAQIALTQPGDGSVQLSVKSGVLPQGAYRVGLTLADVCIDPIGTAEAAAEGGPEAMIPVLEIGALQIDGAGRSAFSGGAGIEQIVGADLGGTAILIVPAEGGISGPPSASDENGKAAEPAVVCAVLDEGEVL